MSSESSENVVDVAVSSDVFQNLSSFIVPLGLGKRSDSWLVKSYSHKSSNSMRLCERFVVRSSLTFLWCGSAYAKRPMLKQQAQEKLIARRIRQKESLASSVVAPS